MLLTRLTQRRILDAQGEPVHSVQTGGAQSVAAVRHTNIIAHYEDRVCREVGRISEIRRGHLPRSKSPLAPRSGY